MHTDIFTYFTEPTGQSALLYSAETWVRIELQLETAGPVAVGTRQSVVPVLSGKGILLPPDGEPITFVMPKGDRLYVAAESVNRVKTIVEPIPWLQQILTHLDEGFGGLKGILGAVVRRGNKNPSPCPPPPAIPPLGRR